MEYGGGGDGITHITREIRGATISWERDKFLICRRRVCLFTGVSSNESTKFKLISLSGHLSNFLLPVSDTKVPRWTLKSQYLLIIRRHSFLIDSFGLGEFLLIRPAFLAG